MSEERRGVLEERREESEERTMGNNCVKKEKVQRGSKKQMFFQ